MSAGAKVQEVEIQANYLLDRLKPLKMLEDNLSRNLSEIKELINQARKQAASVSVESIRAGSTDQFDGKSFSQRSTVVTFCDVFFCFIFHLLV